MTAATVCPDCGTALDQANYSPVTSFGKARPTRIDYDLVCPSCSYTEHVTERPES